MRLQVLCQSCREPVGVQPVVKSRLALAGEKGRTFRKACPGCRRLADYDVNEVRAVAPRTNVRALLLSAAVAVLGTVLLWDLGWVAALPAVAGAGVYAAWTRQESARVRAFNGFRVGRRPEAAARDQQAPLAPEAARR